MILSKNEISSRIASQKLVLGYTNLKDQLQPAGIDLTLEKICEFKSEGKIDFDNSERKLSDVEELKFGKDGWADLKKGIYKIQFAEEVRIPSDLAAICILRSSLLRCGCILHQGFWDPGYKGKGESALFVGNEKGIRIKKGAKVAQLIFFKLSSEAEELYSGIHLNENL